ncbi:MAG: RdgB/HAM1 family non-canonical purine NTP pyrophosphatase [Spiribacter sp.]|jgi:XTP/dITP diphosphohydrolase|nr:RdgB/HAM1 family non-canonical purine NTP pyrophosphatase [Spiribacter sp.]MDR9488821.1 RdgB/HAM1 family non-canonical purine NTP pyrophosphatase [Spiribacter sp.]
MTRLSRLVLASGNAGKLKELEALLTPWVERIQTQSFYFVPEAAETGTTFIENAIIKARNAAAHTGLAAIADDSGLEIDALDGQPGVRSARWAGDHADEAANNAQLIDALIDLKASERTARYRCVIALMRHAGDPAPLVAEGVWTGSLIETPAGDNGFGYDPYFYLPSHNCTVAELSADVKNTISHRAQALARLKTKLAVAWPQA